MSRADILRGDPRAKVESPVSIEPKKSAKVLATVEPQVPPDEVERHYLGDGDDFDSYMSSIDREHWGSRMSDDDFDELALKALRNDEGSADYAAKYLYDRMLYDMDRKRWRYYDGRRGAWTIQDNLGTIRQAAKYAIDDRKTRVHQQLKGDDRVKYQSAFTNTASVVNRIVRVLTEHLVAGIEEFNAQPGVYSFPNGLYCPATRQWIVPDPRHRIIGVWSQPLELEIEVGPALEVIDGMLGPGAPDEITWYFILMMLGMATSESIKEEMAPYILSIEGGAGKGVLWYILKRVMPPELLATMPFSTFLSSTKEDAIMNRLAETVGKHLILMSESNPEDELGGDVFKNFLGDADVNARVLYGRIFDYINRATPAFASNNPPRGNYADEAQWERLGPAYFPNAYRGTEAMDKEMKDNYTTPKMVRLWQALIMRAQSLYHESPSGVVIPKSMLKLRDEWRYAGTPVAKWFTADCIKEDGATQDTDVAYLCFVDWWNGQKYKSELPIKDVWAKAVLRIIGANPKDKDSYRIRKTDPGTDKRRYHHRGWRMKYGS